MWYVVRVRANAERRVAQALTSRGVDIFLPLQKRVSKRRGCGFIEIPLFPGYLFAQFERGAMLSVVVCPGVVNLLCRGNVPEPVDPVEMHALQSIVQSALPMTPLPLFTVGQKVRFSHGPLVDVEAIVLKDTSRPRLIVSISLLQRSVAAEIDRDWLYSAEANGGITRWLPAGA